MTSLPLAPRRADFPALDQLINGHPLTYLDSAASAQKPQFVLQRMAEFDARDYSNVHRGVHTLSQRATDAYEAARESVRSFLNASQPDEIVFVRGTTEAINLVATSYLRPRFTPGDEIILTGMEHHSNIVPWQIALPEARIHAVPVTATGELDLDAYAGLLNERTRMVAFTHVSNVLGTVNPVRQMVDMARAAGVATLVDGAQAVAHLPVDVQALGCDFYAFSGHKMYGPSGIGALYGRYDLLRSMPPYQGGGSMIRTVAFDRTTFADPPARFEAGTPNITGAVGLHAAIDYLHALGETPADAYERIGAHDDDLMQYSLAKLAQIHEISVYGAPSHRTACISFNVADVHPHDVGTILDQRGVAVRVGHHCCQPLMRTLQAQATARASFGVYTDRSDIDRLANALHTVRELFA